MLKLIKKKPKNPISLKDHYERRNRILIKRRGGGFGDILMQRMMFEDLSQAFPDIDASFTCPIHYLEMAKHHPFMNAISIETVNEDQFGAVYDISTACRVHETRYGGDNREHRSDIWAAYCGFRLDHHDMHLKPQQDMLTHCNKALKYHNRENKPTILLATKSTNDEFGMNKSLTQGQITDLVNNLRSKYFVFTTHNEKQAIYDQLGVEQFTNIHPQAWIALVAIADYVISVDSATFHVAGGLKKPLVGIFTHTDGKVYGKYYDFVLVQKHKDNGDWACGPCFNMGFCPKTADALKPCLTDLPAADILRGFSEAVLKWPLGENSQRNEGTVSLVRTS